MKKNNKKEIDNNIFNRNSINANGFNKNGFDKNTFDSYEFNNKAINKNRLNYRVIIIIAVIIILLFFIFMGILVNNKNNQENSETLLSENAVSENLLDSVSTIGDNNSLDLDANENASENTDEVVKEAEYNIEEEMEKLESDFDNLLQDSMNKGNQKTVKEGNVNIREKATTESNRVGYISAGKYVYILGTVTDKDNMDWYYVAFDKPSSSQEKSDNGEVAFVVRHNYCAGYIRSDLLN